MKEPKPPSMNEIFAEMEKLRKTAHFLELTEDQKELITRGREGQKKVSYPDLAKLWEKAGWGKVTDGFIRNQYQRISK